MNSQNCELQNSDKTGSLVMISMSDYIIYVNHDYERWLSLILQRTKAKLSYDYVNTSKFRDDLLLLQKKFKFVKCVQMIVLKIQITKSNQNFIWYWCAYNCYHRFIIQRDLIKQVWLCVWDKSIFLHCFIRSVETTTLLLANRLPYRQIRSNNYQQMCPKY